LDFHQGDSRLSVDQLQSFYKGWCACGQDINEGIGGAFIYAIWKKDEPGKAAIVDITFRESHGNAPHVDGYELIPRDLCKGARGSFIWPYVKRDGALRK
jgi:hypothetical protein